MVIGKVYLDTERVDFEGEPPESVSDLWALVEGFLGQSSRVINEFLIDGAAWSPELGEPQEPCNEITIVSLSEEEKVAKIVDQLLDGEEKLTDLWRLGAQESLRQPWKIFQQKALDIFNETQPAIQCIQVLNTFGHQTQAVWERQLSQAEKDLSERLNAVIDHFENGDCVRYSDASAEMATKTLKSVFETLLRDAKPALQSGA